MPSKLPHYALRIPNETMDKLKYIAEFNGRSANKEIEQLILAHIAKFESDKGEIDLTGFSARKRQ
jgi:predicted DNA-binding protein